MSDKKEAIDLAQDEIKTFLKDYKPTSDERTAIQSAMFNFVTLASIGAASLGISARYWARSRATVTRPATAIPTILGTFFGLACGGALGMDKGMHRLRESLPNDSKLLAIIHENDMLKQEAQKETLFSGPIVSTDDNSVAEEGAKDLFLETSLVDSDRSIDTSLEALTEEKLSLNDGSSTSKE